MPPTRSPSRRRSSLLIAAAALTLVNACTTIQRPRVALPSGETTPEVAHVDLDDVQKRFVDGNGRVDYAALQRDPGMLDRYYWWITEESPDNAPERFPTRDDELAYFINAYNAAVLYTVVQYYPVASVTDIGNVFPLNIIDDKVGFFFLQQVEVGGETTNLYDLENSLIRSRFGEPRVHFALNCASIGCPHLPQEAFSAARLQDQLDRETFRFFAQPRNLRFDHDEETVYVSSILKWHGADFTDWLEKNHPDQPATLLTYISLYGPKEHEAALLRARQEGYDVDFIEYDWNLNDQHPTATPR